MSHIVARFSGGFGAFRLDSAFSIPAKGVTALSGPSGCGKTTLLRCLAGLVRLPGGELRVGEETWQTPEDFVPPWRRALGYVFQESHLFPHLTVRENLRFGLRRAKAGMVREPDVIEFFGLAPLLTRTPAKLSGGERQRVAIGRALLAQPRLLLMDEPLVALDRESADEILHRLRGISWRFGVPVIYVSHQMPEIERIAQHLLYMRAGRIESAGPLAALLTDLSLPFATRAEAATVLDLVVSGHDDPYGLTICGAAPLIFVLPGRLGEMGETVRLRILASDVSVSRNPPAASSILNVLPATILAAEPSGPHVTLALGIGTARLLCRITRKSWDNLALTPGTALFAQIKAAALAGAR